MSKFLILSKPIVLLLFLIVFASSIELSKEKSVNNHHNTDIDVSSDDDDVYQQRRTYDLNKLRYFLLTSNAEQRAEKREKQNFYKRQMIREYLQALNDPDRLQEVKKRFCASLEEFKANRAVCFG